MNFDLIIDKLIELSRKTDEMRQMIILNRAGKVSGIDLTVEQKTTFLDRGILAFSEIKVIISELDKEFGV